MIRRDFLTLLLFAGALHGAALAQPRGKIPVIGYLVLGNPEPAFGNFKQGLVKLGYEDGKNIRIEFRSADGKSGYLAVFAEELVRLNVDIIVASQTPAVTAAKQATNRIPIVMASAGDPVGTGLIPSLARPGGNITGTSGSTTEMGVKTLELIREVLPSAKRVALLANATDPFTKVFLAHLQTGGSAMKIEITPYMVRETAEYVTAFQDMVKRRTDVVVVQPSLQRRVAIELAAKHRLASISPSSSFPNDGGLMSYASNASDTMQRVVVYVDRILKGAKPADLPVQQPTRFDLIINMKTAKALGIKIPNSILLRADKVIE